MVKVYVESRIKVQFSVAVIVVSMKPCIVIVLDTLFSTHHDPVPLTYISYSNRFVKILRVKSRIEVHLSAAAVIAVSMKPCIIVVLDTLFKHTP